MYNLREMKQPLIFLLLIVGIFAVAVNGAEVGAKTYHIKSDVKLDSNCYEELYLRATDGLKDSEGRYRNLLGKLTIEHEPTSGPANPEIVNWKMSFDGSKIKVPTLRVYVVTDDTVDHQYINQKFDPTVQNYHFHFKQHTDQSKCPSPTPKEPEPTPQQQQPEQQQPQEQQPTPTTADPETPKTKDPEPKPKLTFLEHQQQHELVLKHHQLLLQQHEQRLQEHKKQLELKHQEMEQKLELKRQELKQRQIDMGTGVKGP